MPTRVFMLMLGIWTFLPQFANGSDVRHTKFADGLWGTWSQTQDSCQGNNDLNVSISDTQFSNAEGKCNVLWIIERPATRGVTYGVRAHCVDPKQSENPRSVDLIFWPQDQDHVLIGNAFSDLKAYQRCPAK